MMRAALLLASLLAASALAGDEAERNPFADEHLSLARLEELGGIRIGEAYRHKDTKWVLAVDCNVSGARKVTVKPRHRDHEQGVRRVSSRIEGGRIYIWVLSAPPREGDPDPECRGAFLGYPHAGRYEVWYLGPAGSEKLLGTADVPQYEVWLRGRPRPAGTDR